MTPTLALNTLIMLSFLLLNQLLISLILYFRSNLSGLQLFKTDSVLSVLDRVLMIGLCGFLLTSKSFSASFHIEWFVYAQTASYATTAVIAFVLVYRRATFFRPKFDLVFLISIFKRSYPFAFFSLLMAFYYRIDSVMLERMLPNGEQQAGIYAQAFRLLDAANMSSPPSSARFQCGAIRRVAPCMVFLCISSFNSSVVRLEAYPLQHVNACRCCARCKVFWYSIHPPSSRPGSVFFYFN